MTITFVDTLEDADVMEMQDKLTLEERTYWEASIERDMREKAEGKSQEHYPIEDLRNRMLESLLFELAKFIFVRFAKTASPRH